MGQLNNHDKFIRILDKYLQFNPNGMYWNITVSSNLDDIISEFKETFGLVKAPRDLVKLLYCNSTIFPEQTFGISIKENI